MPSLSPWIKVSRRTISSRIGKPLKACHPSPNCASTPTFLEFKEFKTRKTINAHNAEIPLVFFKDFDVKKETKPCWDSSGFFQDFNAKKETKNALPRFYWSVSKTSIPRNKECQSCWDSSGLFRRLQHKDHSRKHNWDHQQTVPNKS